MNRLASSKRRKTAWATILVVTSLCGNVKASEALAPSAFRTLCEKVLIKTGVYHPGVRAVINDSSVGAQQIGDYVRVDNRETTVYFTRTNRGVFELNDEHYFPSEFLKAENLKDKKILDLACGDGALVEDLRRKGVEIVGLDVHLNDYQKTRPYYIRAEAGRSGLPPSSFDLILTVQGPISYLFETDVDYVRYILKEANRLLKPGGELWISPLDHDTMNIMTYGQHPEADFAALNLKASGFSVIDFASVDWMLSSINSTHNEAPHYWLRLRKDGSVKARVP